MESQFTRGLPDGMVVASDGMLFELAARTETIEQSEVFEP